jgi:hypothetical protein
VRFPRSAGAAHLRQEGMPLPEMIWPSMESICLVRAHLRETTLSDYSRSSGAAHLPTRGCPCSDLGRARSSRGAIRPLGCEQYRAGQRHGTPRSGLVCGCRPGADFGKATALHTRARGFEETLQSGHPNPVGIAVG